VWYHTLYIRIIFKLCGKPGFEFKTVIEDGLVEVILVLKLNITGIGFYYVLEKPVIGPKLNTAKKRMIS